MRWAEIIEHQGEWFISLLDGKQPLSYWIYALLRMNIGGDPLFTARAVSAAAGGLSCGLLFLIARRIGGPIAGVVSALLWALFPWSMIYDRMVYAESLVNLSGMAVAYTAIRCFQAEFTWKRTAGCALAFAAAILVKSTALLFTPLVAFMALIHGRRNWSAAALRLAVIFGTAGAAMLLLVLATPEAPTAATHSVLLHHSSRFATIADLASNPLRYASEHFPKFGLSAIHYFTWPVALVGLASFGYLAWRKSQAAWIVVSASILPLVFQLFALTVFAQRFSYPHMWPWMLALGVAGADGWKLVSARWSGQRARAAAIVAGFLVVGPFVFRTAGILSDPQKGLTPDDAGRLLGSSVHVGWGVPEAINFLEREAQAGRFVLLTDPYWGVPADMAFAYLNQRHGIQMYEAWWTQIEGKRYPVMPLGGVDVFKSHYQRVGDGRVDFRKARRVYYITDSHYMPPRMMRIRQPGAQLLRSFPKPDGSHSVDVYRLK